MELTLKRSFIGETYTIGKLYVDGSYFCDTLEDTVRDVNRNGIFDNGEKKIPGQTAIPFGRFRIDMETVSPRFSASRTYARIRGRLPRLMEVPHFDGVLIHIGNTPADTAGCILVGRNTIKGRLTDSTVTFFSLYDTLNNAHRKGETIHIEII